MRLLAIASIALTVSALGASGVRADPGPAAQAATATATPRSAGLPRMAIDADTTNGTRPCDPIDSTRLRAPTGGTYTVAICLVDSQGAPDGFEARVIWSGGAANAPEVADVGGALDDNPNFNQAPGPLGSGPDWSCSGFGLSFPTADDPTTHGTTDAHIVCYEKTFSAGALTAEPGLLATLTMAAKGGGTETFTLSNDSLSSVNSPAGTNWQCGVQVSCSGAVVAQGNAPVMATSIATVAAVRATATAGTIGSCPVPAGAIEITTDAARAHGQRVFQAGPNDRIYVRSTPYLCLGLTYNPADPGNPPPDFIPDDFTVTNVGIPGDGYFVAGARQLPSAGSAGPQRRLGALFLLVAIVVAAPGAIVLLCGKSLRR